MTRPRAGLLVLGFRRLVWAGDVDAPALSLAAFEAIGGAMWDWPPATRLC
jgi:hypothetical protein